MMLDNKTFIKVISLVAAICLWVYVMGEIDPNTKENISKIPVSFTGTDALAEKDLAVVQEQEEFISAIVSGKRSDVHDVKRSGLTAYVDVSNCEKGKNNGKININLPEGIKLENISDNTLRFKVEPLVVEKKQVVIEFTGTASGSGNDTVDWVFETDPQTVTVQGAKSSVKKIDCVMGTVDSQIISKEADKWVSVTVAPVTKDNVRIYGVELPVDKVRVNVQRLSKKSAKLEITAENVADGYVVDKLAGLDAVDIAGPADVIKDVKKIKATVDLSGITDSATVEAELDLPEGIFLLQQDEALTVTVVMKAAE